MTRAMASTGWRRQVWLAGQANWDRPLKPRPASAPPAHPLIAQTIRSSAICAARRPRYGVPHARPQRCPLHIDQSCETAAGHHRRS